jgi:Nuclease-related domain
LAAAQPRNVRRGSWLTVHDRAGRYGNVDHIAVGPGGIFLLDSKNLSGTLRLAAEGLRTSYRDAPRDGFTYARLSRAMTGTAAYLKERIAAATGLTYRVRAVVVIWGTYPEPPGEHDGVTYIAGPDLPDWLLGQPKRLSDRDAKLIQLALASGLVVADAGAVIDVGE